MPKTAKQDFTQREFERALKRAEISHVPAFLGSDKFLDMQTGEMLPGLYVGRFGNLNRRATVKYLLSRRAENLEASAAAHLASAKVEKSNPQEPPLL